MSSEALLPKAIFPGLAAKHLPLELDPTPTPLACRASDPELVDPVPDHDLATERQVGILGYGSLKTHLAEFGFLPAIVEKAGRISSLSVSPECMIDSEMTTATCPPVSAVTRIDSQFRAGTQERESAVVNFPGREHIMRQVEDHSLPWRTTDTRPRAWGNSVNFPDVLRELKVCSPSRLNRHPTVVSRVHRYSGGSRTVPMFSASGKAGLLPMPLDGAMNLVSN